MKKILLLLLLCLGWSSISAQTIDELKELKATKQDSIDAIQGRVDALQTQIDAFPGWKFGVRGTIGGSLSGFDNWYSQGTPNNSAGTIGITINPSANFDGDKTFWYNRAQINLGWVKFDDEDDPLDDDSFRETTDVFNIVSLFGYKLSEKLAASAMAEYRTTLLNNFNDPGYLDLGVGITWKPINHLVVVVHPVNYNFVFSKSDDIFESSMGAKIVADYTRKFGGLGLSSNLSMFQSYKSSNLSNWTWTNSFSYKVWKKIGVGFEFSLRDNKQEALNYAVNTLEDADATFGSINNELQTYWLFGLTYDFN